VIGIDFQGASLALASSSFNQGNLKALPWLYSLRYLGELCVSAVNVLENTAHRRDAVVAETTQRKPESGLPIRTIASRLDNSVQ
jgi:hypothetical protein